MARPAAMDRLQFLGNAVTGRRRAVLLPAFLALALLAAASWQNTPGTKASGLPTAISATDGHTCVLTQAGAVKCWGRNDFGQLGIGTNTGPQNCSYSLVCSPQPVGVSGYSSGAVAVSAGFGHTCALAAAGGVKCWGWNLYGQLGDAMTTDQTTPVDVSSLTSGVAAISAGANHTCALTTGGGVKCWGWNVYGQLGDGTTTNRTFPTDVSGLTSNVVAISAGGYHTCALTAGGGIKCWGDNSYGELGVGTNSGPQTCSGNSCSTTPVVVSGLTSSVAAIDTGGDHTCALTTAGGLKCWGRNDNGQLGDGTETGPQTCIISASNYACSTTPVDVSGLSSGVTAVSAGDHHTCAIVTPSGLKCWGDSLYGAIGDGQTCGGDCTTPVDVSGLTSGVVAVAASDFHTCAVVAVGNAKCWGWNPVGEIGDGTYGTTLYRYTPVDVSGFGPDMDGDGCPNVKELQTASGSESSGGRRDPKNPWDYFNPTHDGQNRIDDVLVVAQHYGKNAGDPGYSTDYDRTYLGPNPWNLGPPNGQIRIDDVLLEVKQYHHDCS